MNALAQKIAGLLREGYRLTRESGRYQLEPGCVGQPPPAAGFNDEVYAYWQEPFTADLAPFSEGARCPLSAAQERALMRLERHHFPRLLLSLDGPLNVARLERALRVLVDRHPVLRTHFEEKGGQTFQVVTESYAFPLLTVIDSKTFSRDHFEAHVPQWGRSKAEGPLWRAGLFRRDGNHHALVIWFHQALADGESMTLFTRHLHEALEFGNLRVGPAGGDYATFVRWFAHYWSGARQGVQLAFWHERLAHLPQATALPVDKPGLALQEYREARHVFRLKADTTEAMEQLAVKSGVRLKIAMMGAWVALLARYHGRGDLPVGVPCPTRDHAAWRETLGNFENPVILRIDLSANPSYYQLLQQLEALARQASPCGNAPLQAVAETVLGVNHGGIYPVRGAFAYYEWVYPASAAGVRVTMRDVYQAPIGRDVTMVLNRTAGGFSGAVHFNADRYEADTIARLADYYTYLLGQLPNHSATPVDVLPLLNEVAQESALRVWNEPDRPWCQDQNLIDLFDARVADCRSKEALRTVADPMLGNIGLEYGLLADWSRRICASLRGRGLGPGSLVGVFLHATADAIAVILGVVRAGAAYVPLDPSYPREHIARMVADTDISLMITRVSLAEMLPELADGVDVLCTDEGDALAGDDAAPQPPAIDPSALAYVMFTSGSTGVPKGVAVTHRNIITFISGIEQICLGPDQVFLQSSSLGFDTATFEIWGSMLNGSTLVMPGEHSLDHLPELIRRQGVNTLWLTSHLFQYMVEHHPGVLCGVAQVISGGDVLSPLHVARFLENCEDNQLFNGYGPTEATTFASLCNLRTHGLTPHSAPIGKPLRNTHIYLLDRELKPVPAGVRGEIYIAGEGLARGYMNLPGLTAKCFIPDPFAAMDGPGSRLYRTGDLARHLYNGQLEFLGRLDHLFKVRGFTVDPREVEVMLERYPHVHKALVLARPDGSGSRCLVGYIKTEKPLAEDPEREALKVDLREFLLKKLPGDLVPPSFVFLSDFPLTPAGKVDRAALPNPLAQQKRRSLVQGRLEQLFAETLGEEYQSLGEHLIDAVGMAHTPARLLERLRLELGMDLSDEDISETPVAALAEYVARKRGESPIWDGLQLELTEHDGVLPLSREQLASLSVKRGGARLGDISGNLALSIQFRGKLSVDRLHQALNLLGRRHEILRTTFSDTQAHVCAERKIPLTFVDVSAVAAREKTRTILQDRLVCRPLDERNAPPWRALLIGEIDNSGEKENLHELLLVFHRVVADESTLVLLLHELVDAYYRQAAGDVPIEPTPRLQYGHYALWQQAWLAGEGSARHRDYWRSLLEDAPLLNLDLSRPQGAYVSRAGGTCLFHFPEDLRDSLRALSRQSGCPISIVCKAAFALLLSHYSGQTDLIIGWRVANRSNENLENMAGPLINTLPLRIRTDGDPVFWELLDQVKQMVREARKHRAVPHSVIAQPFPSVVRSLCPVAFSWDMQLESYRLPGLHVHPAWLANGTAGCDLHLHVAEAESGLVAHIVYNKGGFDAPAVSRMGRHLHRLMRCAAQRPGDPISSLSPLAPHERENLLRVWNDTATESPRDRCLPRIFEDIAARRPHTEAMRAPAFALENHRGRYTFAEVNLYADKLAHGLAVRGISLEDRVGICLEQGPAYAIALLAVFKSGACALPLPADIEAAAANEVLDRHGAVILLTHDPGRFGSDAPPILTVPESGLVQGEGRPHTGDLVRPEYPAMICCFDEWGAGAGMAVTHHYLSNILGWYRAHLREDGTTLLYAPTHSLEAVQEVFAGWCSAGKLLVCPQERLMGVASLARLLQQEGVTRLFLPHWRFKQLCFQATRFGPWPAALHEIVLTGDPPMDEPYIASFRERFEGDVYVRHATPACQAICITQLGTAKVESRPFDNTSLYILDRFFRPLPVGVTGRVYVGGVGMPRAYAGDPARTAERFRPNPFTNGEVGTRLFATGLLARFVAGEQGVPHGVAFLGSAEEMVYQKPHLFHASLLVAALEAHPEVWRARLDRNGAEPEDVVATLWVDLPEDGGSEVILQRVLGYLRRTLPEFMVLRLCLEDIKDLV